MIAVNCVNCHQSYPEKGVPYKCPNCGGVFDINYPQSFSFDLLKQKETGIWRYQSVIGLMEDSPRVSLGEGNTPLIWSEVYGKKVAFKCEYLNPTGSFKDRGSAVLVSFLSSRNVKSAIEDSSGNAGASFAAYAAHAGIKARIYMPNSSSGPKRQQVEMYGAELIQIDGSRTKSSEKALLAADSGEIYASHAYLPFNLMGYTTLAYELVEQLGANPGTVVMPVGQGGLFLGLIRGFENLVRSGIVEKIPHLVGVQSLACAPLWALHTFGVAGLSLVRESPSLAEGIVTRYPVRGDEIIAVCDKYQAELLVVAEEEIIPGQERLARLGFYVEPTSAVVWDALAKRITDWTQPIVAVLTGSGLKTVT